MTTNPMNINDYLRVFMQESNIPGHYHQALGALGNWEIVVIADDSGSMLSNMGGTGYSRWAFAQMLCETICRVAQVFDRSGFDLKFLNRVDVDGVTNFDAVRSYFRQIPSGSTPLMKQLEDVIKPYLSSTPPERKTLIYVITDGEPTDKVAGHTVDKQIHVQGKNVADKITPLFRKYFQQPSVAENVAISFVMATTEPSVIEYYTTIVDEAKGAGGKDLLVDVVLPYEQAKEQVETSNRKIRYTEGMHLVKTLVGAINPNVDRMDNHKVNTETTREGDVVVRLDESAACCCTIS